MPDLVRYETVEWSLFSRHGDSTLGELRILLREVADWSDDAHVTCQTVALRRPLPVLTQIPV